MKSWKEVYRLESNWANSKYTETPTLRSNEVFAFSGSRLLVFSVAPLKSKGLAVDILCAKDFSVLGRIAVPHKVVAIATSDGSNEVFLGFSNGSFAFVTEFESQVKRCHTYQSAVPSIAMCSFNESHVCILTKTSSIVLIDRIKEKVVFSMDSFPLLKTLHLDLVSGSVLRVSTSNDYALFQQSFYFNSKGLLRSRLHVAGESSSSGSRSSWVFFSRILCSSQSGNLIATGHDDNTINIFQSMDDSILHLMQLSGHTSAVDSIQWNIPKNQLISAGKDGIRIWYVPRELVFPNSIEWEKKAKIECMQTIPVSAVPISAIHINQHTLITATESKIETRCFV